MKNKTSVARRVAAELGLPVVNLSMAAPVASSSLLGRMRLFTEADFQEMTARCFAK